MIPLFLLTNVVSLYKSLMKYSINTPIRVFHFLAQCHQETGGFKWLSELGGVAYCTNLYETNKQKAKELGNTQNGDGYKFRGRGLIHLTGRGNYAKFSKYSGIDIVSNPDLAMRPDIAIEIGCWYWTQGSAWGNLNKYADSNDILKVTKGVNGGKKGLPQRKAFYDFYKKINIFEVLKKKTNPTTTATATTTKPKSNNNIGYNPFTRLLNYNV